MKISSRQGLNSQGELDNSKRRISIVRIIAIADVFGALTTDCPYRQALDEKAAMEIMQVEAGSHFDPKRLNRPDYIGFELSFIANVFRTAARATDDGEANELYETGLFFYKKHFSAWTAEFGRKVASAAKTNYFMACAAFTVYLTEVLEFDHTEE